MMLPVEGRETEPEIGPARGYRSLTQRVRGIPEFHRIECKEKTGLEMEKPQHRADSGAS